MDKNIKDFLNIQIKNDLAFLIDECYMLDTEYIKAAYPKVYDRFFEALRRIESNFKELNGN